MKKLALLFLMATLFAFQSQGQIATPQPSPTCEVHQNVGLGKIELVYSRPNMRGRTIFAQDGLVPFGSMWRTGANEATKITFSEDVTFGGAEVEAGSYAMLTIPETKEWTVNLYGYESGNFTTYLDRDPIVSVKVASNTLPFEHETFTMSFQSLRMNGADLVIVWEKTNISIPIQTEVDARVTANIERAMSGPSASELYTAASYYYETDKDLEQALEWIVMANDKAPRYWQLRRQSLIEAELGMTEKAIASAKKSLEMAKEAKNQDYVRMNEASIKEWTGKMNK